MTRLRERKIKKNSAFEKITCTNIVKLFSYRCTLSFLVAFYLVFIS